MSRLKINIYIYSEVKNTNTRMRNVIQYDSKKKLISFLVLKGKYLNTSISICIH